MIFNLKTSDLTSDQQKKLSIETEWFANVSWNVCVSLKEVYTDEMARYWKLTSELFEQLTPSLSNLEKKVNWYVLNAQRSF